MENYDDIFSGTTDRRDDGQFDKEAWAAKKQAERDGVYLMIDTYAHEMSIDGGLFSSYLDVQARFDRYSVSNAILIAAQYPSATKLADFDTWKASGVYVNRGEEAITILEPGKEYTRQEDGSTGVFYNPKKVFDISQTSASRTSYRRFPPKGEKPAHSVAPPLPTESSDSAGTPVSQRPAPAVARDGRLLLKALIHNAPCKVAISNSLPENLAAMYQPEQNVVLVRPGMDAPTLFRGIAQELARARMDKGGYECRNPDFVAYSVSYMLCKRNSVSVEGFSFDRVPGEYRQMDAQSLRAEVGAIRDVAGEITADMNRLFAAQEKAQKNREGGAR